jgi:CheY-like chemotaxis protein
VVIPVPAARHRNGGGSRPPTAVLVVDDQAPFRSAARALVGLMHGWAVVGEAENGEDAVRLAAELRPDVVLMDINLPGRNGIDSTRDLLAVHPPAAVVLISTYAAADLPPGAESSGAVGYLRKEELTPRVLREVLAGAPTPAEGQGPAVASGASAGTAGAGGTTGVGTGMEPRTDVPRPGVETT